jgi:hypothetical protein
VTRIEVALSAWESDRSRPIRPAEQPTSGTVSSREWLLMTVVNYTLIARRPSASRPGISPAGAHRASVMRCRRLPMTAVGCGCRCQRSALFPVSAVSWPDDSVAPLVPAAISGPASGEADAPCAIPGPSPEPDSCRTIRQPGSVKGRRSRSRVTPKAPLTGSSCRKTLLGGFGGGHPHFHPHAVCRKPS